MFSFNEYKIKILIVQVLVWGLKIYPQIHVVIHMWSLKAVRIWKFINECKLYLVILFLYGSAWKLLIYEQKNIHFASSLQHLKGYVLLVVL